MDDKQLIELFFQRSETAISKTDEKYGKYCRAIAYNILSSAPDSEECVNDAYLRAWNAIPPQRPDHLSAFLGRITRNLALDRYRHSSREKRGGGQVPLALDELADCIPASHHAESGIRDNSLADALNSFLAGLPAKQRQIFVRRYWHLSPIDEIARDYAVSESNVKVILHRTRKKLKQYLEGKGIEL